MMLPWHTEMLKDRKSLERDLYARHSRNNIFYQFIQLFAGQDTPQTFSEKYIRLTLILQEFVYLTVALQYKESLSRDLYARQSLY